VGEVSREPELTRRQLMAAAGGLAALGGAGFAASELLGGATGYRRLPSFLSGATSPARRFHTRPELKTSAVVVSGATDQPGYLLLAPSWSDVTLPGRLILDNRGEPVWFAQYHLFRLATNLRVQRYRGAPVLTWWEGIIVDYLGQGEGVIADTSYRELARVRAANGRRMDLHELTLTPEGTALFTCYPQTVRVDLTSIGGPRDAKVLESVVQEVDVRTGRLLLEWRSLDHIHPSESYRPLGEPWDYLHANSIAVTGDGQLLVSGRETCSLYKLDRRTGDVIWRLGGKRSDFAMGDGSQFSYQHHAVPVSDTLTTVFDNGSDGKLTPRSQSRALLLEVDEKGRSVRLARSYTHPRPLSTNAEGSVQLLPDGRVLVGWGFAGYTSEFAPGGTLLADARFVASTSSYRAYRMPWRGQPREKPAIALSADPATGGQTVYVSWNGATEVRRWLVHAGADARDLRAVGVAPRRGFETGIELGSASGYVAVSALDAAGNVLARSRALRL
jgi:Arylsulfotransferase (ASST)